MKFVGSLLLATALTCSAPAFAGEEVLYGQQPGWVEPADIQAALAGTTPSSPSFSVACASISNQIRYRASGSQIAVIVGRA